MLKLTGFGFAQNFALSFEQTEVQFLAIFYQKDFIVGSDMKFKWYTIC